ncbi:hypothetical protein RN001_002908 [Aquatica leii]|uniref:Uncharacterized protein n=1 Tax=Aquatica leii TaxID=1421715 RepID=A0AAN7SKF3_9COLE|nr:hypothetical protein RN001_002908 [Aquatica leii]
MNALLAVLVLALSTVNASIIGSAALVGPGTHGATIKGPAVEAAVVGPDGSSIAAVADSGAVVAAPIAGGVVSAAVAPGVIAAHAPLHYAGVAPARIITHGVHGWGYGAPVWW